MSTFSFHSRIALNYIISTGLLIFVVFMIIYQIVSLSVNQHIDNGLISELEKHTEEITISNGTFTLTHDEEWHEREHNTVDVNPVFIQFIDKEGNIIEKSPNLKGLNLPFDAIHFEKDFFDTFLNNKPIRQAQKAITEKGQIIGYLLVAMSLEDTIMILNNLQSVLLITFPLILVLIFTTARFIAARSIKPVKEIITTANKITESDLSRRIILPQNEDELFEMSQTFNALLDRIERALDREKQFTSDASHEFRTPLAVIKGNLEVLIRKPRTQAEYEEKVKFCVHEVDRLNVMIDELLLIARFDNHQLKSKQSSVFLNTLILDSLVRFKNKIETKKITIHQDFKQSNPLQIDAQLLSIVVNNLISNALKYSNENGEVHIQINQTDSETTLSISDNGIGIKNEDLDKIFTPFYRSQLSSNQMVKGSGLGLSIVKKITDALQIKLEVESTINEGSRFTLRFS